MPQRLLSFCFLVILGLGCATQRVAPPHSGPWSLAELQNPVGYNVGNHFGLAEEIYYEGEPYQGRPTQVFAYLAKPTTVSEGKHPAMVLVHGGGGKAFREWAEHWARRGYIAIAMDLAGNGPAGRMLKGGPDQSDTTKFRNFTESETVDMWSYHAVANVIRAHSLLLSLPEVDPNRTGLTGISWGGYLTCLTASLDPRFKVAVPVYGCGFLGDNSVWKDGSLAAMTPEARTRWLRLFDPGSYLSHVRSPMLFLNGTTDFAYPLDSYQKSYRLVPEKYRHLAIVTNLPHGHIWTFPEVDAFVDHALRKGPALPKPGGPQVENGLLTSVVHSSTGIKSVALCYTTNTGPWQKRQWSAVPGSIAKQRASAPLPTSRPLVAYLAIVDERGLRVSSDFVELTGP